MVWRELFASKFQQGQGTGSGLPEECLITRPSSDQRAAGRNCPPVSTWEPFSTTGYWPDRDLDNTAQERESTSVFPQEAQVVHVKLGLVGTFYKQELTALSSSTDSASSTTWGSSTPTNCIELWRLQAGWLAQRLLMVIDTDYERRGNNYS